MNGTSPLWRIARDRRLWLGPAPLLVALFALVNVIDFRWQETIRRERADSLLAGSRVLQPGVVPRFDWSVGEDLGRFLVFVPDARRAPLTIVAGMSQMYAINEPEPRDLSISELLDDALAPSGARAFGLAAPNLNSEEAFLLLHAVLERAETRPAVFLYGVCFDKFRNVDLRPSLTRFLAADESLQTSWRYACRGREARFRFACRKVEDTAQKVTTAAGTREPDLEARLRAFVASASPLVGHQSDLNAWLQQRAFLFRNWLLGIKPTSKRSVIASRYRLNQEFLELLIETALERGVTPMLYVIPLNPLGENPYIPSEYEAFKRWLARLAQDRGVPFANLERAVPSEQWGEFMGGPDFKHFKGEGHRRTATALLDAFGPAIRQATKRPSP